MDIILGLYKLNFIKPALKYKITQMREVVGKHW